MKSKNTLTVVIRTSLLVTGLTFATDNLLGGTTGNLLVNPGAELGLTGWTIGGPAVAFVDNGTFDPGINPHSGSFDFVGGEGNITGLSGPNGSLSQLVSLIGNQGITASEIDSGGSFANLSFWAQGLDQGTPSDDAFVELRFLDASLGVLGVVDSPEIDSHNLSWQNYSDTVSILSGTRFIEYSMQFVRHAGVDLDAFVDDNSLTVTTPQNVPDSLNFGFVLVSILGVLALGEFFKKRPRTGLFTGFQVHSSQ